ncbi:MAG: MBOAT family protein, partial [Flavobacteriales bacterium]
MLFNSFAFAVFLPLAFALYWWVFRRLRAQNLLVLLASWLFYAWWDWRFLALLIVSTAADFVIGLRIHDAADARRRRRWLMASIAINIGLLGFFKY